MQNIALLRKKLETIDAGHRSLPFWAWNDALDEKELVRQIQAFSRAGMGGFFIHSREGLETEYLGPSWMKMVECCITEASKLGLETWIYDEDKWPSGSVGGKVSAFDPEHFTAKVITLEETVLPNEETLNHLQTQSQTLGIYRYERIENTFYHVQGTIEAFPLCVLIARIEKSGPSSWYNNSAPTDMMNPDAICHFLNETHQAYKHTIKPELHSQLKGYFSDEPNVMDFFLSIPSKRPYLPWSEFFLSEFETRRGYDIKAQVPYLFLDNEEGNGVRFDYWRTVSELFLDSYTKQVQRWCKTHGLLLAGHMLYENDLGYQVRTSGAVMPHYRYLDMPAIDLLGDQCSEYLTVKQCSSVANQFGKKHVLSETYGCTGWDLTFQTQLRLGNWQYLMGITRRCQHLALYTIAGCRKRDYPPSFNYQSPWFDKLSLLEEYFARLSVCTTEGEVQRDILVIHPISSFWIDARSDLKEDLSKIEMNMGWTEPSLVTANKNGDWYNNFAKDLLKNHYDFDFGDEQILKEEASVVENKMQVGQKKYRIVIVTSVKTLFSSTLSLLQSFVQNNGHLIWMGTTLPTLEGRYSDEVQKLYHHPSVLHANHTADVLSVLKQHYARSVWMQSLEGLSLDGFISMHRISGSCHFFIILNLKTEQVTEAYLATPYTGKLYKYDLWKNTFEHEKQAQYDKHTYINRCSFEADEAQVFILDTAQKTDCLILEPRYQHPHESRTILASLPQKSPITLSCYNAMTLDICRYRIGEEAYSASQPVWMAQRQLRERLLMPPNHRNGEMQRYLWLKEKNDFSRHRVSFRFLFTVEEHLETGLFVGIEKALDYEVLLDGEKLERHTQYFLDRLLHCFAIPHASPKEHVLEIHLAYSQEIEFEDIYLFGSFSVSPDRTLKKAVSVLERGDWCTQGLKQYPGNVTYHYLLPPFPEPETEVFLLIKQFAGTLALVTINEEEPLSVLCNNTSLSIGSLLSKTKENTLSIEIVGSLRNLLGPLHRSAESCARISWEDFRTEGAAYSPYYQTKAMGLLDEVVLYSL